MNLFENLQLLKETNNAYHALTRNKREAQEILSHYTVNQVDYIKRGYDEYIAKSGQAYVDEKTFDKSKFKNEFAADCVEWDIVTSEEFEDIWNALEKLGPIEAHTIA